jgi:hypothetical protein
MEALKRRHESVYPAASKRQRREDATLVMLPDEVLLLIASSLLERNAVYCALNFCRASASLSHRLATVPTQVEDRRLTWVPELAFKVNDAGTAHDIHVTSNGEQCVALAAATAIVGRVLPTTGCHTWRLKVDHCINSVIRIGVCTDWPKGHAWGFHPFTGRMQHFCWNDRGALDFAASQAGGSSANGFPDGHNTPVSWSDDVAVRATVSFRGDAFTKSVRSVKCTLDRDAGTLAITLEQSSHPIVCIDASPCRFELVRLPVLALTGVPRDAEIRPWVYLSNPTDSVTWQGAFVRTHPGGGAVRPESLLPDGHPPSDARGIPHWRLKHDGPGDAPISAIQTDPSLFAAAVQRWLDSI